MGGRYLGFSSKVVAQMTITKRGGRREGAGAKPKPPAQVASVRIVANVTQDEAAEWQRRGRTAWLRAELRNRSAEEGETIKQLIRACAAWEPDVRVLGNIRAGDALVALENLVKLADAGKLATPDNK